MDSERQNDLQQSIDQFSKSLSEMGVVMVEAVEAIGKMASCLVQCIPVEKLSIIDEKEQR